MPRATRPTVPTFRDEAAAIPVGETKYIVDLDEPTVEALANGIVPEALAERMFQNLRWRRDAYRALARDGVKGSA